MLSAYKGAAMKKIALLLGTALCMVGVPLSVVVSAQTVPDSTTDPKALAQTRIEDRRQAREEKIAEIQANVAERRAMIKQDVCENRQERMQNRMTALSRSAGNVQDAIDGAYERVQDFYTNRELTVPEYDALVAAVESARTESEASLEALDSYEFEVDCASSTVAEQVDAYRTAAQTVRDDLKSYRQALVDLIRAVKTSVEGLEE